ncbi:MAG: hypothetical protein ACLFUJ_14840 [Phycisphaerae bacterium]
MADLNTLLPDCLPVQPPLGDETLGRIPAKRGVALLSGAEDQPILLLPAADLRSRIRNRVSQPTEEELTRMPDLAEVTRSVRWLLTTSHFETDLSYFELARQIWPDRYREMIAFKPPWFVQVDPSEPRPHFRRGRDVLQRAGACVGPFVSARSADKFIGIIEDVLGLCRDPRCLAQAPDAPVCTYGQMGRCLRPCDGTISLETYRQHVVEAAALAQGSIEPVHQELAGRMKQAAAELKFEQAAAIKSRLGRLDELGDAEFRHVRPRQQLGYVTIQRGRRHQVKVFLVWAGRVASAGLIDFPPKKQTIEPILCQMEQMARQAGSWSLPERLRMGLVAQMLGSSPSRGGVWLEWAPGLDPEEVIGATERACEQLKVSPRPRRKKKQAPKGEAKTDTVTEAHRDPEAS